ncbi:DUF2063 domain-containing protein [Pusillimonas sp. DMV24BSW_D]|uniref:HvfC/BufC N-terminal domain-containing protein n=1 Tax=Neopusillimonas aestuarii TaxID=2716226 RepID=UPI00140DB00D|nr:DNA-binding domain-containing protein [Pusillimonas sp. DMV24BSW_D]QIM48163.1 DUF2063 domain-containing protein [Pusillimonas sp. DMV24BSW_D]
MSIYPDFAGALLDVNQVTPTALIAWSGSNVDRRFDVYKNNVMVSLLNALSDSFPVTVQLTGMDFFRAMARHYVVQSPPRTPVLAWYGETFPDFISGFAPVASLPYLADVARLEFAWLSCFHSADHVPISAQALRQGLADYESGHPEQGGGDAFFIELAPSVRVVESSYPIFSIWSAHQPESGVQFSEVDLSQAQSILLTRPGYAVCLDLVSADTARCLSKAAQSGLGNELLDSVEFDIAALLALLIEREAIVSLKNNTTGVPI